MKDWEVELDERFVYESCIRGGSWRFLSKEEGELIKSFIRPILSTARQEAEQKGLVRGINFIQKIRNMNDKEFDKYIKSIDSFTSKGGTNG